MKTKRNKNNKGFSLIELIIAVAILVVLSGLLAPQLIKYIEKSREAKDMQAIDSVYVAVSTALADEKAYTDFVEKTKDSKALANITTDDGMTLAAIIEDDGDFAKELESILGKKDIQLKSKRAQGDINVKVTNSGNVVAWAANASADDKADFTIVENAENGNEEIPTT